ncbi:hypothetical protein V1477_004831 [Vespula maculifrons]|uniref:Uncharacterized protein n=1 Tax=Vespula maculifrons TaxID=7453 RepID=A0ABD2CN65_VESMC
MSKLVENYTSSIRESKNKNKKKRPRHAYHTGVIRMSFSIMYESMQAWQTSKCNDKACTKSDVHPAIDYWIVTGIMISSSNKKFRTRIRMH